MKETMESLRQKLAEASMEKQSLLTELKQAKERLLKEMKRLAKHNVSLLTELKQTKERVSYSDNDLSELRKQHNQIGNWLSGIGVPSIVKSNEGSYPIYLDIISRLMYLATKMQLKEEKCQDQS